MFCIVFAFAFWFTKPRVIDHIYGGNATSKVIVVLFQGWLEKSAKMREDAQNRICEIKKEISIWIIVMKCCLLMRKNKLERNMTWGHVLLHYCIISMLFSAKWEKTPKNKSLLTTKRYFLSMLLKNWKSVIISNYNLQVWLEENKMRNEYTFIYIMIVCHFYILEIRSALFSVHFCPMLPGSSLEVPALSKYFFLPGFLGEIFEQIGSIIFAKESSFGIQASATWTFLAS